MNLPLLPLFIASITTFLAIHLLRPFALSINLVDIPNDRKLHTGSVPLIGGIAMFLAVVISILVSSYDLNQFNYFLLVSLIIVMIGVLDDHRNISVPLRLFFQVVVALIVTTVAGTSIESLGNLLGNGEIFLDEWTTFVTVIAVIAGMNAVNMADGLHGLAGGNSLITFLAILYLSNDSASQGSLFILLLFCVILPVFLIHNMCLGISKSKRVFMGDAGSLFIGLTIGWLLIDLSQGEGRSFSPVTALWLFTMPLIEMAIAILRRIASGTSPFKPDLFHSHHLLLRLGIKGKYTLLLILLVSLLMAIIGILGEQYGASDRSMFIGFLLVFGIYIFAYGMALRSIQNNGK